MCMHRGKSRTEECSLSLPAFCPSHIPNNFLFLSPLFLQTLPFSSHALLPPFRRFCKNLRACCEINSWEGIELSRLLKFPEIILEQLVLSSEFTNEAHSWLHKTFGSTVLSSDNDGLIC